MLLLDWIGPNAEIAIFYCVCQSDFFISQLIDRADRKLFKQIQLSQHCLNSLLPSPRLPYSRYSLRSRGHQFSLPQLNSVSYKKLRICSLIDVCFSIFSSIIPPHCIVRFFSSHCIVFFFFVICVKHADVTFIYQRLLDLT